MLVKCIRTYQYSVTDVSMVIVKDWASRYSVSTSRRPRVNVCPSRLTKSIDSFSTFIVQKNIMSFVYFDYNIMFSKIYFGDSFLLISDFNNIFSDNNATVFSRPLSLSCLNTNIFAYQSKPCFV
jgi:hypothetical protein